MSKRPDKLAQEADEWTNGWLLTSMGKETTGLDAVIWVSIAVDSVPRVKVVPGHNWKKGCVGATTVTLDDPPKVLGKLPKQLEKQVVELIGLNKKAILDHWNGDIDSGDIIDAVAASMKKPDKLAKKVADRYAFNKLAMANLLSDRTGIKDAVIWVSTGEAYGTAIKHGPRIKVFQGTKATQEAQKNAVAVKLTTPPQVVGTLPGKLKKQVFEFIELNRETLLSFWNGEISDQTMKAQIQRI